MKTVAIAGLGLIGGSMALDLKKSGFAQKIIGVESSVAHQNIAIKKGLVDSVCSLEEAVRQADLIVLATPIDHIRQVLPHILDITKGSGKAVTDTGSTKKSIIQRIANHPERGRFVAGHPMAGTEHSGPQAAHHDLFKGKNTILCNTEASQDRPLKLVETMYEHLGMSIIYMDALQHDISAAYVSHVSHVVSFALSLCVQEKEKNQQQITKLAGGGFASTVRLASSASSTWTPILKDNAAPLLEAIDALTAQIAEFRKLIASGDQQCINQLIIQAGKIQPIIRQNNENR